ncbi:MAG: helix-turn-helix domain-containing protein [Thermodesulfovibrionales bacterium]
MKKIRKLLIDRDLDVAKLSRLINKSRTWTSQVLYDRENSPATRKLIASALDVPESELWPDRRAA